MSFKVFILLVILIINCLIINVNSLARFGWPSASTTTTTTIAPSTSTSSILRKNASIHRNLDNVPTIVKTFATGNFTGPSTYPTDCHLKYLCKKRVKIPNSQPVEYDCIKYQITALACNDGTEYDQRQRNWFLFVNSGGPTSSTSQNDLNNNPNRPMTGTKVHMIDFPCQANYLPDKRGICREVW